jgi:hypothetical protein
MPITFAPRSAYSGFDRSAAPKWQMVPVGGERILTLTGVGTLVPRIRNDAALEITQTVSRGVVTLKLKGKAAGRAFVEWVPSAAFSGPVLASDTLEVSVKDLKELDTAFHYVDDGRRQKTSRRIADLDRMIAATNHILTPQANVSVKRKSAAALPIAQNLGDVVRFSSHLTGAPDNVPVAQHEWDDVTAHADATADYNVFFVKEYEQDKTPYHDDAEAGTIASEKNTIMEDNISYPPAQTLAHEIIHLLGIGDHSTSLYHLIGTNRRGWLITRDQANIVNTSGT